MAPTVRGSNFDAAVTEEPGGIRLTARTDEASFTDWDLYLMGLLPASEVAPQIVFANQAPAGVACNGQLFTGPVTRIGIDELIAAAGPRVPAAEGKPRRFRLGTVIVSRDGLLSDDAMAFYSYFASRIELTTPTPIHVGFLTAIGKPLPVATGGRASFDGRLLTARERLRAVGVARRLVDLTPSVGDRQYHAAFQRRRVCSIR